MLLIWYFNNIEHFLKQFLKEGLNSPESRPVTLSRTSEELVSVDMGEDLKNHWSEGVVEEAVYSHSRVTPLPAETLLELELDVSRASELGVVEGFVGVGS